MVRPFCHRRNTTQGDPLAMGMYALGTLPLIHELKPHVRQVWFADDTMAGGKLTQLREWWDKIVSLGPIFGYFANPSKTWLIVKSPHISRLPQSYSMELRSTSQLRANDIWGEL